MIRHLARALGLVLVVAAGAAAQTATPTSKLAWDENAQSVAAASAATYNVYIDAAAAAPLSGVTCAVSVAPAPTGASCQAPFPAMTPGAHTLALTQVISGAESPKSSPVLAITFVVVVTPTGIKVIP